ncbi:polyamine ABC transporter substrate-binding protein [Granulosicoccus antarcticus]|nr:polyamine ABC transporter substrate-binding protein [Granulosicoccus antarcticus]
MLKNIVRTMVGFALISTAHAQEEKVLNIYNWSDYIAKDTIANFEAETGIKVNYDVYDSNELLESKLIAGSSGYDVVVPTAPFLERQIMSGVFAELDRSKLSNYGNLDTEILTRMAAHDPDNAHSVPYTWGTTGFAYNVDKVAAAMPDAPVDSWDMILNPEVAEKFQSCGVTVAEAPTEVFGIVMAYLGKDPYSNDVKDVELFEEHMLKVRPFIKYFHSSQNINDLANGEICVSMGYNGDMLIARDRASEASNGVDIKYVIPKEGAAIWFDSLAVPADAPHPDNAHQFINYMMRPQVIADVSNYVFYANANSASTEFVSDEVKSDPAIYPSEAVKALLFADLADERKFTRALSRAWTTIKTGK